MQTEKHPFDSTLPPQWPPETCEEVQLWLNARADGECSPAQEGWLAGHLGRCPACSLEWAALEQTRLALETAQLREPSDFEREALAQALAPRALEGLGWLLSGAGVLILGGYAGWEMGHDADTPALVRIALGALFAGLLLLLARVGWERLRIRRHDPYRNVQR